jgi:threonylcarbamoyladenosine tRNA methylthiotransferase MtaB
MKKIVIATLGCKANQFDSALIEQSITQSDLKVVPVDESADIYIINTCTVTKKTDYQSRQLIRRFHRKNPKALIIVTGCYAQVNPDEISRIPGVDYILGNREKGEIGQVLRHLQKRNRPIIRVGSIAEERRLRCPTINKFPQHSRAFLKIQDGCNRRCSYCILPYARGPTRSLEPEQVLRQIKRFGSAGYREVVLSGINLGSYGLELSPCFSLLDLLLNLEERRLVQRIRLSSLNPDEISEDIINLLASSEILCPHLHISLQSGDNQVLRRMGRNYTSDSFSELVRKIKSQIPEASIGVDVIVGFPGEGEENFQNTYKLLEILPITYLHIFPFSKRPGTPAAQFSGQVNGLVIRDRSKRLRELGRQKRRQFYQDFIGKSSMVLVERKRDRISGLLKGYSRNYLPVLIKGGNELMSREVKVQISQVSREKLYASLEMR